MSGPACWESGWLYVHQDTQTSSLLEPLAGEMTKHSHRPQPDISELRRPARAQGPSPGRPSLFAGSIFLSGWQDTCALPLGPASTGHTPTDPPTPGQLWQTAHSDSCTANSAFKLAEAVL